MTIEQHNKKENLSRFFQDEDFVNFLGFFVFAPHQLQNSSLKDRFTERISQIIVRLPGIKRHLEQDNIEIANQRFDSVKKKLLLFYDFILTIYKIDEKEFVKQFMEEDDSEEMENQIKKTYQEVTKNEEFKIKINKIRKSLISMSCNIDSIDNFYEELKDNNIL